MLSESSMLPGTLRSATRRGGGAPTVVSLPENLRRQLAVRAWSSTECSLWPLMARARVIGDNQPGRVQSDGDEPWDRRRAGHVGALIAGPRRGR